MINILKLLKNKNFTKIVQLLTVKPILEYLKHDTNNIHLVILFLTVFNVIVEIIVSLIELSTSKHARKNLSNFLFKLITDLVVVPTLYFQFMTNKFYNFTNWVSLLNIFYQCLNCIIVCFHVIIFAICCRF